MYKLAYSAQTRSIFKSKESALYLSITQHSHFHIPLSSQFQPSLYLHLHTGTALWDCGGFPPLLPPPPPLIRAISICSPGIPFGSVTCDLHSGLEPAWCTGQRCGDKGTEVGMRACRCDCQDVLQPPTASAAVLSGAEQGSKPWAGFGGAAS